MTVAHHDMSCFFFAAWQMSKIVKSSPLHTCFLYCRTCVQLYKKGNILMLLFIYFQPVKQEKKLRDASAHSLTGGKSTEKEN